MSEGIITIIIYNEVNNSADINQYLTNNNIKGVAIDTECLVSAYQLKLAFHKALLSEKQNIMKAKNNFQSEVAYYLTISGRVTEGVKQFAPSVSTTTVAVAILTQSKDEAELNISKMNECIQYKSLNMDENSFIVVNEMKLKQLIEIYKLCPEEVGGSGSDISMDIYKNVEDAVITKLAIKNL